MTYVAHNVVKSSADPRGEISQAQEQPPGAGRSEAPVSTQSHAAGSNASNREGGDKNFAPTAAQRGATYAVARDAIASAATATGCRERSTGDPDHMEGGLCVRSKSCPWFPEGGLRHQRRPVRAKWSSTVDLEGIRPQDELIVARDLAHLFEYSEAPRPVNTKLPGSAPGVLNKSSTLPTSLCGPGSGKEGGRNGCRRRPCTAGQAPSRVCMAPPARQRRPNARKPSQGARPASAPRLLRGEGFLKPETHEDPFLQNIENVEVRRCVEKMRLARLPDKDRADEAGDMSDTSLFDLKVLHNKSVRSISASSVAAMVMEAPPKRVERNPVGNRMARRWEDLTALDRTKRLCWVLASAQVRQHLDL